MLGLAAVIIGGVFVALGGRQGPAPYPSPSAGGVARPSVAPTITPSPSPPLSPAPTPRPSPTPVPTPSIYVSPDGYTITVPAGWTGRTIDPNDIAPLLDLIGTAQPEAADLLRTYLNVTGARVSLVAVDNDVSHYVDGLPPTANVLIQPSFGLSLSFVGSNVAQIIGGLPAVSGDVSREEVTLPAGPAMRLTFRVATDGAAGPSAAVVSYLLVRGSSAYLYTLVAPESEAVRDTQVFEVMIRSLCFEACPA